MSSEDIGIRIGELELLGTLDLPPRATGLVMFAHGSGSSRRSPRNRHVAVQLRERGLGTLLFDLITAEEDRIDAVATTLRLDADLLAERLAAAAESITATGASRGLPIGYFGGSTGGAAALIAAARKPALVSAVVARGGRTDLVMSTIADVKAPTLFIVGGADPTILRSNREAAARMIAPHVIEVVPDAGHLFEEPGALDTVARLAGSWFVARFSEATTRAAS